MTIRGLESLPTPVAEVVTTAVGQAHREDPALPRTGGPAGNARLTAWLGLFLLVAFLVECATLLSLHGLLSAHIFVGALLVPLGAAIRVYYMKNQSANSKGWQSVASGVDTAVADGASTISLSFGACAASSGYKTAQQAFARALAKKVTTTWRMLRYYGRNVDYRRAGPPPLLLRLLGPLVVLTSLAVLGTGLALIALGSNEGGRLGSFAGFRLDALTLHKAAFVLWLVVTSLHTLGRVVPAALIAGKRIGPRVVPGGGLRIVVLALIIAVSVLTGAVVLSLSNYGSGRDRGFERSGMAGHWGSAHIQPHRSSLCMTCFNVRPAGSAGAVIVGAAPA